MGLPGRGGVVLIPDLTDDALARFEKAVSKSVEKIRNIRRGDKRERRRDQLKKSDDNFLPEEAENEITDHAFDRIERLEELLDLVNDVVDELNDLNDPEDNGDGKTGDGDSGGGKPGCKDGGPPPA